MAKKSLILLMLFINICCYSQVNTTIKKLETEHQKCLDKGESMLNCTLVFYNLMDDLLNVTYKEIRLKLNKTDQQKLKELQLSWLKKRDAYFKQVEKKTTKLLEGDNSSQDFRMICTNSNAVFVKDRIIELEKIYK